MPLYGSFGRTNQSSFHGHQARGTQGGTEMKGYGTSCGKLSLLAARWPRWDCPAQRDALALSRPFGEDRRASGKPVAAARPWFKGGGAGWLVIGALVVGWDLIAPETLSAAFRRARSGRVGSTVVVMAWACLTGHLFQVIPDRADPFVALFITAPRVVRGQLTRPAADPAQWQ